MPAGWRTLGASRNKRNRDRTKRKRQNSKPKKTNDDSPVDLPAAAATVSRPYVKSHEAETPPRDNTIEEISYVTMQTNDIEVEKSPSSEIPAEQTTAEKKPESPKTPDQVVKEKTPEQRVENMKLSPIRTRLDLETVEVKPRLKKSLKFSSNVPRKKKVSKKEEKLPNPTSENKPAPEQNAGAVQGISMLWKNEFSRDAKKKIEQVKLQQIWKSLKSSKVDVSKKSTSETEKLLKPKFENKATIIPISVPTGPPTGMTSQGGRPSEWFKLRRSSSENSFFSPPKLPKEEKSSKLNPFVKAFTPTPVATSKKFQFSHVNQPDGKLKTFERQPLSSQPFVRPTSGVGMLNTTVPIFSTKSASLPVPANPMLSVQRGHLRANGNLVQTPIMNNAVVNTNRYDFVNTQNIQMLSSRPINQAPRHINGTPILAGRNSNNYIIPYSTQNLSPISAQKWQAQSVTAIPMVNNPVVTNTVSSPVVTGGVCNPVVTRKLQHNFGGFQQRVIPSTAATLTGYSQSHAGLARVTSQSHAQHPSRFGSQFIHGQNRTFSRPSVMRTMGLRPPATFQNKTTAAYNHPKSIHVANPIERPILSSHKVPAPLHISDVEPKQQKESPQTSMNGKSASEFSNELQGDNYSEPQNLNTYKETTQWTLPRPLDITNRFPLGVFDSTQSTEKAEFVENKPFNWNDSALTASQLSSPRILEPYTNIFSIPHQRVFGFLTIHDLSVLRRVCKSMARIVQETPYITNMVIDGTQGVIGINNMGISKGKWVHDLDSVMRLFTSKGIEKLELEPSTYTKIFWDKFLDWLRQDGSTNIKSVLVLKGSADEETSEDSGIFDFLVGLCPNLLKIHSGINVDAKFLRRLDCAGVEALVFSREITWDQEMICAVYDRVHPLKEITLACPPHKIVPWLSKFLNLEKLRLLHDPSDKSRLTDKDLVTILSTVRLVELDCSLLSTWGFPEPTDSMVTTSITILTTCGESISRNWLEKTLKRVPKKVTRFHLKNLSEPLSLNHLEDVPYKPEKANLEKLKGLSNPRLKITGEQCHDCRVLGLDCCLVIV